MPRTNRVSVGNIVYHVINRTNGRVCLFKEDKDYKHFESLLKEARDLTDMRILSYCLMPNHFHLVLYPKKDNDLSEFMRWLTTTHVRQVRVLTGSVGHGHLYQGTYKSFPVEGDKHLVDLIRYVEQNPFRAGLVKKAQDWLWSSLYIRKYGTSGQKKILDELPTELPHNYLSSVNEIYDSEKLSRLRNSITKGLPYGSDKWTDSMVEKFNLVATTRGVGRPKRV